MYTYSSWNIDWKPRVARAILCGSKTGTPTTTLQVDSYSVYKIPKYTSYFVHVDIYGNLYAGHELTRTVYNMTRTRVVLGRYELISTRNVADTKRLKSVTVYSRYSSIKGVKTGINSTPKFVYVKRNAKL